MAVINSNEPEGTGELQVNVVNELNVPIGDATVQITDENNENETVETNSSGQTEEIQLKTPNIEYSLDSSNTIQPYANYNVRVSAEGYNTEVVENVELLADRRAIQNIVLTRSERGVDYINIPPHTLYAEYPPKQYESEIKLERESGDIVLSRVVVPEYVIVHDGTPSSNAKDYYVTYRDYIKNVASSEIYATWPQAAIEANILAIMSFTLNRVYTEWYRNKGYNFTITSSTAYDQKWIYGRNIYENISQTVDNIFNQYLSRPNVKQPILTQYCDGKRVTCPNWLSQWGSCDLAEQGYSRLEIIRRYYGDDMYINSAEQISGVPSSWPGYNLTQGASGPKVMQMQEQLNTIAEVYTAIPRLQADGLFGPATEEAVRAFQKIFGLTPDGIVGFATWYKISQIYVGITRIAEGTPR